MFLFTLISGKTVHLPIGKKVVPKKAFASMVEANELLQEATKEVDAYRKQVIEECKLLKEEAVKQGFDEGLEKLNTHILKLDKTLKTISEEVKNQILPLALKAVRKIVGEELKLAPDRIIDVVMQALKPVVQHHKITIYVNRDDLKIIENNKKKIKSILQQVEVLSFQERADIEAGGCIIETESGIINAQLENQLLALEAAFKTFIKK